ECSRAWRSALRRSSAERTRTVGVRWGEVRSIPAGSVSVANMAVSGCVVLDAFPHRARCTAMQTAEVAKTNTAGSGRWKLLEPGVGPVQLALRGKRADLRHPRRRRPQSGPRQDFLNRLRVALDDGFHR